MLAGDDEGDAIDEPGWVPEAFSTQRTQELEDALVRPPLLEYLAIAFGLMLIAAAIWIVIDPRQGTIGQALVSAGTGCCFFMLAVPGIRFKWRRTRRRDRAVVVPIPDGFPADGFHLGPPISVHPARRSTSWISLLLVLVLGWLFLIVQVVRGEFNDTRTKLAIILYPVACFLIARIGLRNRRDRVFVFADGFILLRNDRGDMWPWEQLAGVKVQADRLVGKRVLSTVTTLIRNDGATFTVSMSLEFFENQLGVRAQHEICRRLLEPSWKTLASSGSVHFGPVEMSRTELCWGMKVLSWEEIGWVEPGREAVGVYRVDDQRKTAWLIPLGSLTNAALFWVLAQRLLTAKGADAER